MNKKIPMICMPLGAIIAIAYSFFASKMDISPAVGTNIIYVATMLMMTGVIFVVVDIGEKYKSNLEKDNKKKR